MVIGLNNFLTYFWEKLFEVYFISGRQELNKFAQIVSYIWIVIEVLRFGLSHNGNNRQELVHIISALKQWYPTN